MSLFSLWLADADAADINWLETTRSLGVIREEDGRKGSSFRFINVGKEATLIQRVKASCGCTSISFSEEMINPGDTATVRFEFNPAGRPGKFEKNIRVFIGKDGEPYDLQISGTVLASPETLNKLYPYSVGPLRYDQSTILFGEIKKGSNRHMFLNLYNESNDTLYPVAKSSTSAIETDVTPGKIPPGETGTLGLYYVTEKENLYGPSEHKLIICLGDGETGETEIELRGDIRPVFVTYDDNNKPMMSFSREVIEMGENVEDKEYPFEIIINNEGTADLNILRVYSNSEAVAIKRAPGKIKPGKEGEIKGILKGNKLENGAFRIEINVMNDDRENPVKIVKIVGLRV